jgi:hypothetical protein
MNTGDEVPSVIVVILVVVALALWGLSWVIL